MVQVLSILSIFWCFHSIAQGQVTKIDNSLKLKLNKGNANVFVSFGSSPLGIIQNTTKQSFANRSAAALQLVNSLKNHAEAHQKAVQEMLNSYRASFLSYWICNRIYIRNCKYDVMLALTNSSDVTGIDEERVFIMGQTPVETSSTALATEWGVVTVGAPSVWKKTTGSGVVVANIDTGVLWTHETLKANYFGYWFDPITNTTLPDDGDGHGTHTMGTFVGQNGIGVAPGAKWIACRGCDPNGCPESALLACGQWVLCADGTSNGCLVIPNVVSNSWGSNNRSTFYDTTIAAWHAVNIYPVFSNGNTGPNCGTTGSPASSADVISVGAINQSLFLADFSSRSLSLGLAPSPIVVYKPDVVAPGVNVRSAFNTSDTAYAISSGTSMATPHVSGVIALLLSACPTFQARYNDTKAIFLQGVTRTGLAKPAIVCELCNAMSIKPLFYPNNEYGQGLVNALTSANIISSQCS